MKGGNYMKKLFVLFTILISYLCVSCNTNVESYSDVEYEVFDEGYKFFVFNSENVKVYIFHDVGNTRIEYSDVFTEFANPEYGKAEISYYINNGSYSHGVRYDNIIQKNVPVLYLYF
jgi:hypothetical protein